MNAWTVLFWAAMALFLVDLAWLYAAQFLWYIMYGTKYDTVPWLLSWMTNDAFIVTPGVDAGISASGSDGFTPEQWQQIYNLLLLEWVLITLINQSTVVPPLAAESSTGNVSKAESNVDDDLVSEDSSKVPLPHAPESHVSVAPT